MNRRGFLGWLAALVPGLAVARKVEAEDIEVTISGIPKVGEPFPMEGRVVRKKPMSEWFQPLISMPYTAYRDLRYTPGFFMAGCEVTRQNGDVVIWPCPWLFEDATSTG